MMSRAGHTEPRHHPPEALLVDYASGAASEGEALMIACHLAWCADCRDAVAAAEAVGGALLGALPAAELPPDALNRALQAIESLPAEAPAGPQHAIRLPAPLLPYLGGELEAVAWRKMIAGFGSHTVLKEPKARLNLLKAPAGRSVLTHRHQGEEWTLVLQGSFRDGQSVYRVGDFALAATGTRHRLTAGREEDCICMILSKGPVRYTGLIGALMQPLINR